MAPEATQYSGVATWYCIHVYLSTLYHPGSRIYPQVSAAMNSVPVHPRFAFGFDSGACVPWRLAYPCVVMHFHRRTLRPSLAQQVNLGKGTKGIICLEIVVLDRSSWNRQDWEIQNRNFHIGFCSLYQWAQKFQKDQTRHLQIVVIP